MVKLIVKDKFYIIYSEQQDFGRYQKSQKKIEEKDPKGKYSSKLL